MCKVLEVSRSGYYKWLKEGPSKRWQEDERLLTDIIDLFDHSKKSYGSPRMTHELRSQGRTVSINKVAKMMKGAGLYARKPKRFKATTDSRYNYPIAPNYLNQDFSVSRIAEVWVSDITYVLTAGGWLYLTVIIDLFDRKVIGWSMSKRLTTEGTIIPAWFMAVRNRPITKELTFHSDRGVQFACKDFTTILKSNPLVRQSMSRKGNCWDNAVAESFFKTLKVEWIYDQKFENHSMAQLSIFEWIEGWYNRRRRHSALNFLTIEEFERNNYKFENVA